MKKNEVKIKIDKLKELGLVNEKTTIVANHFSHNGGASYDDMVQEAKKYNVVLELNCGCFINEKPKEMFGEIRYRYPYNKFWEIAKKEGNTIVVGIDAHAPSAFTSKNIEIIHQGIKADG